ncbi:MAG TPA: helix-turn-helix transcriptional regulator [Trebonia sp.]|jgi:transcriptional regulator with XRE-family HTH domain|nr:helix-turn-helix transcriptional regulator [Trebonia sp.]
MDAPVPVTPPGTDDGMAVATGRKVRGLTQRELALQAAISLSMLRKIEQGDRPLTPGVRAALAQALGPLPLAPDGTPAAGRIAAAIPLLQDIMDAYDLPPDLPAGPRPLPQLRSAVATATQWRLASRYAELAELLPGLIPELTAAAITSTGPQQDHAYGLLALAYRAADAIADKHGHRDLSARAVGLTRWAAARSANPALEMMAAYVRAELFFTGNHATAGLRLLDNATATTPDHRDIPRLAMLGALQMRAAVLAAHAGMPAEAADRMTEARAAASYLPDGIYHGTAFGPSSVRVHELATAVEASDTTRALQVISQWHPPGTLPAERRSHFHIEAARAYHWAGKPDQAITALCQARQAAPQHTRYNPAATSTIQALINTKRRPSPALLQLASWAGIT